MPSIHELLDDTQKQGQALLAEMESFKKAKEIHQDSAESLERICAALEESAKAITPFTESRLRNLQLLLYASMAFNLLLLVITLVFK